ncbi:15340_t:CDS:2, partial [Funneliformis caledonium]
NTISILILCDVVMINGACLDVAHLLYKPLLGYGGIAPVGVKLKHDISARLKDSLFLANTFYELELSQYLPPKILEIDPALLDKSSPHTRELSSVIKEFYREPWNKQFSTLKKTTFFYNDSLKQLKKNIINGVIWFGQSLSETDFSAT